MELRTTQKITPESSFYYLNTLGIWFHSFGYRNCWLNRIIYLIDHRTITRRVKAILTVVSADALVIAEKLVSIDMCRTAKGSAKIKSQPDSISVRRPSRAS